ncbi:heterokaryon incompatibility, partial [Halenospora varia]
DYAALSYVWGNQTSRRKIIVNGHEMHVTSNLEGALRALRNQSDFEGKFRLWVNAICINQKDEEERNR